MLDTLKYVIYASCSMTKLNLMNLFTYLYEIIANLLNLYKVDHTVLVKI